MSTFFKILIGAIIAGAFTVMGFITWVLVLVLQVGIPTLIILWILDFFKLVNIW